MIMQKSDFDRLARIWEKKTCALFGIVYSMYIKTFKDGRVSFCMKPYRHGEFNNG